MKATVKALLLALSVLFLFGLSACKSDAEKLVSYMEEMGGIIEKNKDDCDKMGDELQKFADSNGKEMQELMKKLKDDKAEQEKYKDRMDKVEKQMEMIGECFMNEKVMKAFGGIMKE